MIPERRGRGTPSSPSEATRVTATGSYRILAKIEDKKLIILVIAVGHRREIYE